MPITQLVRRQAKQKMSRLFSYALVVVSVLTFFTSGSALAIDPARLHQPVVGGTVLTMSLGNECTAGLVLKQKGFLANLTPYRRAVRFVLTAGHCGDYNSAVSVRGSDLGYVSWKSNVSDLELIRVEPVNHSYRYCSAPSTGLTCSVVSRYEPRALGKVLLSRAALYRSREEGLASIAVSGHAPASPTERFCTSGRTTDVMCYWTDARIPAGKTITAGLLGATADFGDLIGPGDSGGPVVNASGVMHGIIKGNSADFNMLLYTSTAQFFHEQPDYEIAPPN
ncbi:S1 family peptidase [Xanthomonas cucurbitae]|uniref:S1 family peptidase n=2 Tax=Xanthomonas cucurbitae TaxID=56453 RepID=A0A2S7DRI7_9XANT|nr:hypothetical protein [Xanthomonas cucurbitae]PPU76435.1 hypothetical protein XcuCFBP2542_10355 [Xanthomonas cucurbitae]WDM67581.1 S1 family peptidase [Xanthomonas cucurbitae]WDM71457.1 S1 family peptidase [Xanthomonas cucurbitae]WDM79272.1 S1 family peptidase [Xanthomonas cucurbitae]WDM82958.1 S1 family peptidase [Xanthomonas cucurbitae]